MKRTASSLLPLIAIDHSASIPIHKQIYNSLRDAIVNNRIRSGQRIPSTRILASEIGVSRFPVLTAYSQLLAEGYLESRVGSGTVVSRSPPERFLQSRRPQTLHSTSGTQSLVVSGSDSIRDHSPRPAWLRGRGAFHVGEIAFDAFPHQLWAKLVTRQSQDQTVDSLRYPQTMGLPVLREQIAEYLRTARSVNCEVDQIMVVSGAQQALDLSARVLAKSCDSVWVEEPGYWPARNVFLQVGCRLIPIPIDAQGMDVSAGIKQCRSAKLAVVTPSHQFPLGVTMTTARRLELLEWAADTGAWIIEDDYDSEYRYDVSPIASLQGLDKASRVIYIGTFSKVLFPSLRLGYLVVPRPLLPEFARVRALMDSCPPAFFQEVVAEFLSKGHFGRHLRRMRTLYHRRRGILVAELNAKFGSRISIIGDEAGMYLTMIIPKTLSDVEIAERAVHQDLWLWPLSTCYSETPLNHGFILGFANTNEGEARRGVDKLRTLLIRE